MFEIARETIETQQYDLSVGQKELWFIHSLGNAAESAYNEHLIYSLKGFLSVQTLKKAFAHLISHHPILRTGFDKGPQGHIFQTVYPQAKCDFAVINHQDKENIRAYITEQISKPFDLKQPSLMRASLVKVNEEEFILIITLHHIIIDGTSFSIFIDDLNVFYNRLISNEEIIHIQPSYSYWDHVKTEKEYFLSKEYHQKVHAVAETLKGYAGLNFLTTPQKSENIFSGDRVYFSLNEMTCTKLYAFSKTHRVTVFHVLYAVYCILLNRYTRSQDILVGVPFANRGDEAKRKIMGYFVNTLPIRIALVENESFLELLTRIKTTLFTSLCNQEVIFEHIASQLNLTRKNAGQHLLIQTMFAWANTEKVTLKLDQIVSKQIHGYFSKTAKFDLSLFMFEENKEKITGYIEYRNQLFERKMIERFSSHFTYLLNNILNHPQELIRSYSLMDDVEIQRMKNTYFNAKLDRVVKTSLAVLFSNTASHFSENIGLIFGKKRFDYATMQKRSNQWAFYIRVQFKKVYGYELPADTLIILCVDRNEDMIFGILGILKAGAAYVPVDPHHPQERITYMINHSKASLLLTHKKHDALNLDFPAEKIIYMDDESILKCSDFIDKPIHHTVKPHDLAYVLYTSGSTGQPKGVGVSHENIICLFEGIKKQFDLSSGDVWTLFHTFCFDISVWEMWGAFLFGGSLIVVPYEITRDTKKFYELVESEKVTVLTQTASAFQMFITEAIRSNKNLNHLRYVSFVGESLKVSILRPWVERYGVRQPQLANMYGITETTVYTNNKFISQADIDRGRDNIGWPLEEFSMCIMDENLQWCPVGIIGEICIGGRGLSRGYLHRDDLTQEKFVKDPYAAFLGLPENTRLYRTGDLGRWMEDGSIEYLGRKDFQIKLRGFRIELGEIESALGSYPGITHTSIILKGEGETAYLAAYFTIETGVQIELNSLKHYLSCFLPEYMLPKTYTELASFPMTVNGKIDKNTLFTLEDRVSIEKSIIPLSSVREFDIAQVWADIFKMNIDELEASSNFFELGGNSLLVVQMLAIVSNKVGQELSLSQFIAMPTIAMLSDQIDPSTKVSEKMTSFCEQLKVDTILEPDILPLQEINPYARNPNSILLTGSTGFIGAHLLNELMRSTDTRIYCLVRASSIEAGLKLILGKLKKYKLFSYQNSSRIIPILGDVAEEQLGLSNDDYLRISQEVDAIFHVGAWVHHIYDYNTLYKTNVQSVRKLLKMATYIKNKAIHFISTLGTIFISPIEILPHSSYDSIEFDLNSNGYLTTKWAAEQLLKEAAGRGIIAHIYRPGNVIAGNHGVYEPESNHTLLRLKGMLQLEKGFVKPEETVEMMPVDLLVETIITISNNPKKFSYNLHNVHSITWSHYLKMAKNKKYRIDFIENEDEWNQIMTNLNEQNPLYKLSHLYKGQSSKINAHRENKTIIPDYIIETPPYEKMIEQQLSSLIACGFLPNKKDEIDVENL